jgi:hypothetical protein
VIDTAFPSAGVTVTMSMSGSAAIHVGFYPLRLPGRIEPMRAGFYDDGLAAMGRS